MRIINYINVTQEIGTGEHLGREEELSRSGATARDIDTLKEKIAGYYDDLYRFCLSHLGSEKNREQIAADLAQDAIVRALRSIATYRGEGELKGWLMVIALNKIRTYFKKKRRDMLASAQSLTPEQGERDLTEALPDLRTGEDIEVNQLYWASRQRELEAAIKELPDHLRNTLALYREGQTDTEIAKRLGIPPATVRNRVHRAKNLIREELGVELTKSIENRGKKPLAA